MITWVIALAAALLAQWLEPASKVKAGVRWPAILTLSALGFALVAFSSDFIEDDIIDALLPFQLTRMSRYDLHPALIFASAFLLVDLLQYGLHVLMHKVNVLWRAHSIHHSDAQVSALTGLLHHPAEALIGYFLIVLCGVMIGLPIVVLVIYGFVTSLHNAFVHANFVLPKRLDQILRAVIVTPSMHRTHHLASAREGNSNFGQLFSFWDRLFSTYVFDADLSGMMGLPSPAQPRRFTASGLMLHPFDRRT